MAVAEERGRIARELHDVVAHAVSVMVLQVGAVRHRMPESAAADRDALRNVEEAGRTALTEMRRLLAAMRDDDDAARAGAEPWARRPRPARARRPRGGARRPGRGAGRAGRAAAAAWTSRRTASCRRRSRTASSTPARTVRRWWWSTRPPSCVCRCVTRDGRGADAGRRHRRRPRPDRHPGAGQDLRWRSSPSVRRPAAASCSGRCCRWEVARDHPGPRRRRPDHGARRVPAAARRRARHRGRGRGRATAATRSRRPRASDPTSS